MTFIVATTKLILNIMWLSCVIAVAATVMVTSRAVSVTATAASRASVLATSTFASLRTRFSKA